MSLMDLPTTEDLVSYDVWSFHAAKPAPITYSLAHTHTIQGEGPPPNIVALGRSLLAEGVFSAPRDKWSPTKNVKGKDILPLSAEPSEVLPFSESFELGGESTTVDERYLEPLKPDPSTVQVPPIASRHRDSIQLRKVVGLRASSAANLTKVKGGRRLREVARRRRKQKVPRQRTPQLKTGNPPTSSTSTPGGPSIRGTEPDTSRSLSEQKEGLLSVSEWVATLSDLYTINPSEAEALAKGSSTNSVLLRNAAKRFARRGKEEVKQEDQKGNCESGKTNASTEIEDNELEQRSYASELYGMETEEEILDRKQSQMQAEAEHSYLGHELNEFMHTKSQELGSKTLPQPDDSFSSSSMSQEEQEFSDDDDVPLIDTDRTEGNLGSLAPETSIVSLQNPADEDDGSGPGLAKASVQAEPSFEATKPLLLPPIALKFDAKGTRPDVGHERLPMRHIPRRYSLSDLKEAAKTENYALHYSFGTRWQPLFAYRRETTRLLRQANIAKPQELRPVAIDRMRRRLPRPRSAEPHLRVFSVPRDEFEKTVTYSKRLQVFDRPESRNPYRPPKPKPPSPKKLYAMTSTLAQQRLVEEAAREAFQRDLVIAAERYEVVAHKKEAPPSIMRTPGQPPAKTKTNVYNSIQGYDTVLMDVDKQFKGEGKPVFPPRPPPSNLAVRFTGKQDNAQFPKLDAVSEETVQVKAGTRKRDKETKKTKGLAFGHIDFQPSKDTVDVFRDPAGSFQRPPGPRSGDLTAPHGQVFTSTTKYSATPFDHTFATTGDRIGHGVVAEYAKYAKKISEEDAFLRKHRGEPMPRKHLGRPSASATSMTIPASHSPFPSSPLRRSGDAASVPMLQLQRAQEIEDTLRSSRQLTKSRRSGSESGRSKLYKAKTESLAKIAAKKAAADSAQRYENAKEALIAEMVATSGRASQASSRGGTGRRRASSRSRDGRPNLASEATTTTSGIHVPKLDLSKVSRGSEPTRKGGSSSATSGEEPVHSKGKANISSDALEPRLQIMYASKLLSYLYSEQVLPPDVAKPLHEALQREADDAVHGLSHSQVLKMLLAHVVEAHVPRAVLAELLAEVFDGVKTVYSVKK